LDEKLAETKSAGKFQRNTPPAIRYYGYDLPLTKLIVAVACIGLAIVAIFFVFVAPPEQLAQLLGQGQQVIVQAKPINSKDSAISASDVLFEYSLNVSQTNSEYFGKLVYLYGIVGSVEQGPAGTHESCIDSNSIGSILIYGCVQAIGKAGWIIWNWNSQTSISNIPIGGNFVAECTIGGMTGDNLVLNSCSIVN
jgi:hypothetical protein